MKDSGPAKRRNTNSQQIAAPRQRVRLTSALKSEDVTSKLKRLSPAVLSQLRYDLGMFLYWWTGEPTEEKILGFQRTAPFLEELFDFRIVVSRLGNLNSFKRDEFGIRLCTFFPELCAVRAVLSPSQWFNTSRHRRVRPLLTGRSSVRKRLGSQIFLTSKFSPHLWLTEPAI